MANKTKIKIEGLSELIAGLEELPPRTGKNVLKRVLTEIAQPIVDTAKQYVPRGATGRLANSIGISTRLNRTNARGVKYAGKQQMEIYVGPAGVPYSSLVEFGTYKMRPRPYMRPAWESHKGPALESVKEKLWAEIKAAADRVARKAAKAANK